MELELKHITKNYGKRNILKDISLSASPGCCIGILGANGSGKSTLLSILAGILPSDGGSFLLDGRDLLQDWHKRAELVGYVPQGTPLMEELTARDNLLLWYPRTELERSLKDGVLSLLGIGEFLDRPVRKLSGGMRKRLCIGCAMAKQPPVLLLDEPCTALDLVCKEQICRYLEGYKEKGGILLLTTHDISELRLCDRIYILKNGVLVPCLFDGDLKKLTESL